MVNPISLLTALGLLILSAMPALADLPRPTGDVLLTVTGEITDTNGEAAAIFDLDMLQQLEATTFITSTPWTEGDQTFTGVSLAALLRAVGGAGRTLHATAINDYRIEIPAEDAVDGRAMVAYLRNGSPMSVRDKGPLWIVYPFDSSEEYQSEVIYSRSIWQLDRIDIRR